MDDLRTVISSCQFNENRYSESHVLFKGVNKLLSVLPTFHVLPDKNSV
jgi:hypothetical protein